ncbi:MAG: hypothetical protein H7Y00_10355 [Fimbriimonadaceae bacterium]|nr:hypothetical protein [Chitinophagales bacterium]
MRKGETGFIYHESIYLKNLLITNKQKNMEALSKKKNKIIFSSFLLLGLTGLFWLSLIMQKFFESDTLTNFFLQIDKISPLLSVSIMLIFPLIAITINALSILKFQINFNGDDLHIEIDLHKNFLQWVLIAYACLSVGLVLAYLFFENLTVVHVGV